MIHRTGRLLNGVGAAFLLLLNATGMVIWWPGIRNWKRALKVDFERNWRRVNFDLHVSVGFWTILIASFWAMSGIYFGWPRQVFQFVNSFSPVITARPPAINVTPESTVPEPDLRALVHRAYTIDPGTTLGGIAFPYSRESAPRHSHAPAQHSGLRIRGHRVLQSIQRRVHFHVAVRSEPESSAIGSSGRRCLCTLAPIGGWASRLFGLRQAWPSRCSR